MILTICLAIILIFILAAGFTYTDSSDGPNIFRYGAGLVITAALMVASTVGPMDDIANFNEEREVLMEVIEERDTEITKLLEVIGPGFKSVEGEYTLNDIVYVNADTTGVEFTLESGPFYWKGSYSKAFEVLEKLSIPDTGVFYFYTLQDILSKELKENN